MARAGLTSIFIAVGATTLSVAAGAAMVAASGRPDPELVEPERSAPNGLVALYDGEGRRLLFESEAHAAFLPLVSHFETQHSLTHCGVASIAMVLNALGVPAPAPEAFAPYRVFTQDIVLNGLTDEIVDDRAVARRGMTLQELADVLAVYDVAVDAHYAGQSSIDHFRAAAIDHLADEDQHVIVNYSRSALGQDGTGHISPLGAYDAESDRFLILDVSRYKAPAVWAPAERLFAAMAEPVGPGETRTRGFVLVRKEDA